MKTRHARRIRKGILMARRPPATFRAPVGGGVTRQAFERSLRVQVRSALRRRDAQMALESLGTSESWLEAEDYFRARARAE